MNVDDFENNLGTTSAHAENTFETFTSVAQNRNYLRARGEYDEKQEIIDLERELPPRTRRIRVSPLSPNQDRGTTSAHAENTTTALLQSCGRWNYLRARGEYRLGFVKSFASSGTTSAHAENTFWPFGRRLRTWNYLRARGEYRQGCLRLIKLLELPPRTRRIRPQESSIICFLGTTSAHAENTTAWVF